MEPITWFTGVVEFVIGGYAYYLFKGSEFSHLGFRKGILMWQLAKQHKKRNYSEEKYLDMTRQIAELETQISLVKSQPFIKYE